jgi:hypothetical protein
LWCSTFVSAAVFAEISTAGIFLAGSFSGFFFEAEETEGKGYRIFAPSPTVSSLKQKIQFKVREVRERQGSFRIKRKLTSLNPPWKIEKELAVVQKKFPGVGVNLWRRRSLRD